jgi:hypothetical protein
LSTPNFEDAFLSFVFNFAEFPGSGREAAAYRIELVKSNLIFSLGLGCEQASLMLPTFYPCPDRPEHPMQHAR